MNQGLLGRLAASPGWGSGILDLGAVFLVVQWPFSPLGNIPWEFFPGHSGKGAEACSRGNCMAEKSLNSSEKNHRITIRLEKTSEVESNL